MKKQHILIVFIFAALLITTSCSPKNTADNTIPTDLNFGNSPNNNQNTKPTLEEGATFPDSYEIPKKRVDPVNIYTKNDIIQFRNLTYENFKIVKSKELINGINKNDVNYYYETPPLRLDDQGKLLDDNSYLFITMDISNHTNEALDVPVSNGWLQLDENNSYASGYDTTVYRSGTPPTDEKHYLFQILNPKEKLTITIALILSDDVINSNNLYVVFRGVETQEDIEISNKSPETYELEEMKFLKIN